MGRYVLMLTNLVRRVLDDFSAQRTVLFWGNKNKACFLEREPQGGFFTFLHSPCIAVMQELWGFLMQRSCMYWVSKVIEVSLWYGVSHGLPTKRGCVCSHQPCASLPLITYIPQGRSKPPSSDGLETFWLSAVLRIPRALRRRIHQILLRTQLGLQFNHL